MGAALGGAGLGGQARMGVPAGKTRTWKTVVTREIDRASGQQQGPCRICLELGAPRFSFCKCSGSSQWTHRHCVETWRLYSRNALQCELCKSNYVGLSALPQPRQSRRPTALEPPTAAALRAILYDPRMCPVCRLGPVVYTGCDSLYMFANGGNSCSNCSFYSASRSDWPAWNGALPASWAVAQPCLAAAVLSRIYSFLCFLYVFANKCRRFVSQCASSLFVYVRQWAEEPVNRENVLAIFCTLSISLAALLIESDFGTKEQSGLAAVVLFLYVTKCGRCVSEYRSWTMVCMFALVSLECLLLLVLARYTILPKL